MAGTTSMATSGADDSSSGAAAPLTKAKRYLSHQHSSPCPPFYPHVDMHMPMYAMRPYGPPAYPKNDYHMPMYHGHHHQPPQYIHQQSYSSYAPKQTVQYVKQMSPIYHHPVVAPPVHHPQPIQPVYKPSPPVHHQQPILPVYKPSPPVYYHHEKQPVFAYAPAYHKPMPMIWQGPQVKVDYPVHQIPYHKPAIVYKPDPPKCAPCPSAHQPQGFHHPQPSVSYVKVAQPIVHQMTHAPAQHYLPAPVHQPIVKPCDK